MTPSDLISVIITALFAAVVLWLILGGNEPDGRA